MDLQQTLFWKHRDDLLRILAVLWRMAGLGSQKTIRQSLALAVIRLLRPAEAATRRLIVVLAQKTTVTLKPFRAGRAKPKLPDSKSDRNCADSEPAWKNFALTDPMPRWPDIPRGFPGIIPTQDKEISGQRLALRFEALNHALDDLNAQAQRMARWTALRLRARQRGRHRATTPLRAGVPADLRGAAGKRLKRHELHSILKDAHQRAWWAVNARHDTS